MQSRVAMGVNPNYPDILVWSIAMAATALLLIENLKRAGIRIPKKYENKSMLWKFGRVRRYFCLTLQFAVWGDIAEFNELVMIK